MGGRDTKVKWLKIGRFDDWPLARAREYARAYRAQRDAGIDPAAALAEKKAQGMTVGEVTERFMTEHVKPKLKARTLETYKTIVKNLILPGLGKIPMKDLNREMVSKWHVSASKRGQIHANCALTLLSSICRFAEWNELRPEHSNPCSYVKRFQITPRQRDIEPHELEAIGAAIQSLDGKVNIYALAAIKVIAVLPNLCKPTHN